jgi:hypothetical protein
MWCLNNHVESIENKMMNVLIERKLRVPLHLSSLIDAEILLRTSFNAGVTSTEHLSENRPLPALTQAIGKTDPEHVRREEQGLELVNSEFCLLLPTSFTTAQAMYLFTERCNNFSNETICYPTTKFSIH